jgi:type I restriction enzyme S subunit
VRFEAARAQCLWPVIPLKRIAQIGPGEGRPDGDNEGDIPLLGANGRIGVVGRGNLDGPAVIVGRVGSAGAVNVASPPVWISDNALIVRPDTGTGLRFLAYVLPLLDLGEDAAQTAQPLITQTQVAERYVPHPSLATQRAIADYLDRETARIDALIEAKRRMVELFEEQFASRRERLLVTEGTTSWTPLHHLTDPLRPIVYGIVQAGDEFPGGVPYIKTGDLPELDPARLSRTSPEIDNAYQRARVVPGDIVVAMRASIGTAVPVPQSLPIANLTQGTARVTPRKGVDGRWLLHAFRTRAVQEQCSVRAVGTTFKTLNIWDLRRVQVPTPPPECCSALADKVQLFAEQRDHMSAVLERQIDLLQERRQALVTAAVTGQLDIAEAA